MFIMILLLVILLLLSGGSARVVNDFLSECGEFFASNFSPTVFAESRYKQICQTLNNMPFYATLYDTDNKIPVYSAYKFKGLKRCKRPGNFFIEPQLDDNDINRINMEPDPQYFLENQAVNADYRNSGYERGHLAPVYHASSQECAYATFTLTNAAPQRSSFNKQWFHRVEKIIADTLNDQCRDNTAYIITGVVPGVERINNRVKVPSGFWTAYCCNRENNRPMSGGAVMFNSNVKNPEFMSVIMLESKLTDLYDNLYDTSFHLFDNNCKNADYVAVRKYRRNRRPRKRLTLRSQKIINMGN